MFLGSGVCDDIIPEPARNRPGTGCLQYPEQAAGAAPEASLFSGAVTPLPIDPAGPWYAVSAGLRADLFARALHPRGFVTGADRGFGPNMMLRRREALRSLKGPLVLGPGPALRKGKRVFPFGDASGMIARLERGAGARVSHGPGLPDGSGVHAETGTESRNRRGDPRAASPARLAGAGAHGLRGAPPGGADLAGPLARWPDPAGRVPARAALRVQLASGAGERGVVRAFRPCGRQGRGAEGTCRGSRRALTPAPTG